MLRKIFTSISFLLILGSICLAQGNDIQIKKKTSFKIPGMPSGMAGMSALENRPSTIYIRGTRMRTDMPYKKQKMMGGKETVTQTMIMQCDKQRRVQFNSKSKKYYTDFLAGNSPDAVKNARTGGIVIMTGSVTDTGERAKLFGYDARRLRQTYTITPGKNACLKEKLTLEIDGWYADLPEFSCPIKRDPKEFQMDGNCFDEVDYQVKGAISGVAMKEIKKITYSGMAMSIEEEVVELTKTTLKDDFFEAPVNYKAANTLKEVEEDEGGGGGADENTSAANAPLPIVEAADSKLSLPKAGLEKSDSGAKKAGIIRIGIVAPSVKTPDSKKGEDSPQKEIASAVSAFLLEKFKTEKVEAVELTSNAPEAEAKQKECDYIFYTTIVQKRAGMLGKVMAMSGMGSAMNQNQNQNQMVNESEAAMEMRQMMARYAEIKDEFAFEYKTTDLNKTIIAQAATKAKAKQYGEDVLSPQIKDASSAVLGKISK